MLVTLMKADRLSTITLPVKIKGRFWMNDLDPNGKLRKLISIEDVSGKWVIKSNRITNILSADATDKKNTVLEAFSFYSLHIKDIDEQAILFAEPITEERQTFTKYMVKPQSQITIGRHENCVIQYTNKYVSNKHAVISYMNGVWKISDESSTNGTYVDGLRVKEKTLKVGDVIFIMGMKIIIGYNTIAINNPDHQVHLDESILYRFKMQEIKKTEEDDLDGDDDFSEEHRYFYRSPRFKRDVRLKKIKIDSPPSPQNLEQIPLALMLGPSLTMGMVSIATASLTVNNIVNGTASVASSMTTLLMSLSMMLSSILWPILTKRHERKTKAKNEAKRQQKYTDYLLEVRNDIAKEAMLQTEILNENSISLESCMERILSQKRDLWERSLGHNDFLSLRLGYGELPLQAEIVYPEKRFTMLDDNLQNDLYKLAEEPKRLKNVPIALDLMSDYISGIIGKRSDVLHLVQNMLVQLVALHSYDEVKLFFLIDANELAVWEYVKWLPHVWQDDKSMRFIATDLNETKELSVFLEREVLSREADKKELSEYAPHYVIIAASKTLSDKAEIMTQLLKQKKNLGFSLITLFDELKNLPKECTRVVDLTANQAEIYDKNDISGDKINFIMEQYKIDDVMKLSTALANIYLDLSSQRYALPNMLTFLEMYHVGKTEHLNPLMRWRENDPTKSLQAAVGVDGSGEIFTLDLHEKFHGPHGLVAGMTGSGKSEFIITYILSMAINYHPDEVAFILIDYKGGGLTGAFEDSEKGIKLPHLAGTITNLDGASVKRSLISIQSELRRRQSVFNEARKISNEGTMDIYKYQKLHRDGIVKEAIPHLFIISDEFAELKQQQPEFMEQLISAARIGRSLGVHLILATQKPSGVVDDQIWSNSRFRVCLKVQEKADSMDMIKRPDAASLATTGRFYLQVGFNEFFDLGQSAWCGAPYHPMDQVEKKIDNSIKVIDHLGRTIKEVKPADKRKHQAAKLNQIVAIVKHLSDLSKEEKIQVRPLWLDAIPAVIQVDALTTKYPHGEQKFILNPVVGEYDDPFNQRQSIMTVPLSMDGNVIIYGAAGSGKGVLITTMVYSLITKHTPDEVNLYLLDFGTETLRMFTKAPHVGDVLFSTDGEKISNLFKMLEKEVVTRKKLFADYGGDYQSYHRNGSNHVPNIVVLINNFSGFYEMFDRFEESLSTLTREGLKVGIIFVLTATSSNAVRYKLQQNFKQTIVLQLNDTTDYSGILGNTEGVYPSKIKGRGLVKYDRLYEFQTAYVCEPGGETEYVKSVCASLTLMSSKTAKKIPILPETVDLDFINADISTLSAVPVGVAKSSLQVSKFDFQSKFISVVTAHDAVTLGSFSLALAQVLTKIEAVKVVYIDAMKMIEKREDLLVAYHNDQFNEIIKDIFTELVTRNNEYKDSGLNHQVLEKYTREVYLISGIKNLMSILGTDEKDKLKVLLEKGEAIYKMHFILCEGISDLSAVSFESWYKRHIAGNEGIWIGDGIADQFTLKVSKMNQSLYDEVGGQFGYTLTKGKPMLMKALSLKINEGEGDSDE